MTVLFGAGATARGRRLDHAWIRGGGNRAWDFPPVEILRRLQQPALRVSLEQAAEIACLVLGVAEGGAAVRNAVRAVSDRLLFGRR